MVAARIFNKVDRMALKIFFLPIIIFTPLLAHNTNRMLLHSGTLLRLTAKVTDRICDPTPSVRAALALLFRT